MNTTTQKLNLQLSTERLNKLLKAIWELMAILLQQEKTSQHMRICLCLLSFTRGFGTYPSSWALYNSNSAVPHLLTLDAFHQYRVCTPSCMWVTSADHGNNECLHFRLSATWLWTYRNTWSAALNADRRGIERKGEKLGIDCAYLNATKVLTVKRHQKGSVRRGENVRDASPLLRYIHIHIHLHIHIHI